MPRSQLTSTNGKSRLTGQKRRQYNYPSKYAQKKWNYAPYGQMGGSIITRIQQVTYLGDVTAVAADVLENYSFRLADLPNHTDFQALYDMYRIVKVVLFFTPLSNQSAFSATGSNRVGMMYTCKDYNSIDAPASVNEILSFQTCKFTPCYEKHVRSIKPQLVAKTIPPGEDIAQTIPYSPSGNPWINIDNESEYYASIKMGIVHSGSNTSLGFSVNAIYHVEFKNVK